jgi:hypothetical protein
MELKPNQRADHDSAAEATRRSAVCPNHWL